jgi:hypothetical protein
MQERSRKSELEGRYENKLHCNMGVDSIVHTKQGIPEGAVNASPMTRILNILNLIRFEVILQLSMATRALGLENNIILPGKVSVLELFLEYKPWILQRRQTEP